MVIPILTLLSIVACAVAAMSLQRARHEREKHLRDRMRDQTQYALLKDRTERITSLLTVTTLKSHLTRVRDLTGLLAENHPQALQDDSTVFEALDRTETFLSELTAEVIGDPSMQVCELYVRGAGFAKARRLSEANNDRNPVVLKFAQEGGR